MDDQFPPFDLTRGPVRWPDWLPTAMLGGAPSPWPTPPTPDLSNQSPPTDGSLGRPTGRGILGQFDAQAADTSGATNGGSQQTSLPLFSTLMAGSPPAGIPSGGWYQNSPSWLRSAMPLGARVESSASVAEPAYQPWINPRDGGDPANPWQRPPSVPMSGAAPPALPQPGPNGWYFPGAQLDPTPEKDFRTRLLEALSDHNIRYYAGPGFAQTLDQLAGLTQILPGSGAVQAWSDGGQAANDANAGNYGRAAAHTAMGTINAALDWVPGGKVATAILGGMGARTFPWAKLRIADAMEKAGRTVDEIWRETGLGKAADGQWRFEIPYRGFQFNPMAGVLDADGFRVAHLFDHYNYPELRAAYPSLTDLLSKIRIGPNAGRRGSFWPDRIEAESKRDWEAELFGVHESTRSKISKDSPAEAASTSS